MENKKYPIVTLCGSTRFKSDFEASNKDLINLGNKLIKDRINTDGLIGTIQYLLKCGFSKNELIENFAFIEKDIDTAVITPDEKDCDNCGMTGVCKTCCKTCGKIDCHNHNPEYEEQWKTKYPMVYAEIMKNNKLQDKEQ